MKVARYLASLKGYRTLILNGVTALAMIGLPIVASPDEVDALLLAVNVIGNIWLRFHTTTPVGGADPA